MEPSLPPIPSNQPMLHLMHNNQYVMKDLPSMLEYLLSNTTICKIYIQYNNFQQHQQHQIHLNITMYKISPLFNNLNVNTSITSVTFDIEDTFDIDDFNVSVIDNKKVNNDNMNVNINKINNNKYKVNGNIHITNKWNRKELEINNKIKIRTDNEWYDGIVIKVITNDDNTNPDMLAKITKLQTCGYYILLALIVISCSLIFGRNDGYIYYLSYTFFCGLMCLIIWSKKINLKKNSNNIFNEFRYKYHCNDTLKDERIVTPSFDADLSEISVDVNAGLALDVSSYESVNILDAIWISDPDYASQIASAVLDRDYSTFESNFDKLSDKVVLAIKDVQTASMLFVITTITALFVSMLWGVCIRRLGAFIIWLSILFTLYGMGLIAYLFGYDTIGEIMYYSGYVLGVIDRISCLNTDNNECNGINSCFATEATKFLTIISSPNENDLNPNDKFSTHYVIEQYELQHICHLLHWVYVLLQHGLHYYYNIIIHINLQMRLIHIQMMI